MIKKLIGFVGGAYARRQWERNQAQVEALRVDKRFRQYRRKQIAELRPYIAGETLSERVSISVADKEAGSPKPGDMIARNPTNHDDQWLVAADYFTANFEEIT